MYDYSHPKIGSWQEELTPKQADYTRDFVWDRTAAMLSTEPIDEAWAEDLLRAAYQVAGREPVPIHWFDSPAAFLFECFSREEDSVKKNMRYILLNSGKSRSESLLMDNVKVGGGFSDSVWDSVQENVVQNVERSVWRHGAWDILRDSLWDTLQNGLWSTLQPDSSWDNDAWKYVEEIYNASVRAYYNADMLSYYSFSHVMSVANDLVHFALFNEMVSGYLLGDKQAWLVRKPIRLQSDARGRLHSADGMCIQYRDGWGVYAWHGIRCSEKLILHPEQITKEDWTHENNLENRRVMLERLGNERFIELVGGKYIDQGQHADLIEVDLGDDPERVARFVQVLDSSTTRIYHLRVPPTINKADEALAWTFGIEAQDYLPVQEA